MKKSITANDYRWLRNAIQSAGGEVTQDAGFLDGGAFMTYAINGKSFSVILTLEAQQQNELRPGTIASGDEHQAVS